MKTQNGFTRFDNVEEFKEWLDKQKVTRTVSRLQVHHTYLPDYSCFYKANGTTEDELTRQKNMKDFHVNTNKWGDIAQHFTVFPNGKIVTGRSLNSTPIGITGWNTGAICIEIYGNFDKGKDVMKKEQKESVKALYYYLAKKFNLSINNTNIRPHAWFTSSGTYLGYYSASKSAKTCAGTNFWGHGINTKADFQHFLDDVKNYKETKIIESYIVRVISETLTIREGAGLSYKKTGQLKKGDAYTIIEEKNSWGRLKSGQGWISLGSNYVQKI